MRTNRVILTFTWLFKLFSWVMFTIWSIWIIPLNPVVFTELAHLGIKIYNIWCFEQSNKKIYMCLLHMLIWLIDWLIDWAVFQLYSGQKQVQWYIKTIIELTEGWVTWGNIFGLPLEKYGRDEDILIFCSSYNVPTLFQNL